jgi:vitamin B12 transporter
MRLYILAGLVILSVGLSKAQDTLQLNPVTVTASFNPTPSSHTGRNINVIRSEELRTLPVHSVDELLRYLPGL